MQIFFAVMLACVLIIVGLLLANSPGKPQPFLDQDGNPLAGSISEKTFVTINGVKQGMFIKGKDVNNPVLLYLHGGMPDYFLTQKYPTGLEDDFTIVWWEQRGSGLSYHPDMPSKMITTEQLIADTLAVTDYLRQRFGKEKIYLMGRSGGSFLGIQVAARAPELYHAYIGMAQISDQSKSEWLAYEYMLQAFKDSGNTRMVRRLEAAPVTMTSGISDAYAAVRDEAMHSLGIGTTRDMKSIISGFFLASLFSREYSLMEKINMWRGKAQSGISSMWGEISATDLNQQVPQLALPVYFFGGVYDYTVSSTLAQDYLQRLQAPVKGYYRFEHSAHSPIFEEPDKAHQIMQQDVLAGENNLADIK